MNFASSVFLGEPFKTYTTTASACSFFVLQECAGQVDVKKIRTLYIPMTPWLRFRSWVFSSRQVHSSTVCYSALSCLLYFTSLYNIVSIMFIKSEFSPYMNPFQYIMSCKRWLYCFFNLFVNMTIWKMSNYRAMDQENMLVCLWPLDTFKFSKWLLIVFKSTFTSYEVQ